MDKMKVAVGDKVDVLHDPDSDLWMIKKLVSDDGFTVSGQKNKHGEYTSGAIRLTWRQGFPTLASSDEKNARFLSEERHTKFEDESIIFKLSM
jgi:hypothetical protein